MRGVEEDPVKKLLYHPGLDEERGCCERCELVLPELIDKTHTKSEGNAEHCI